MHIAYDKDMFKNLIKLIKSKKNNQNYILPKKSFFASEKLGESEIPLPTLENTLILGHYGFEFAKAGFNADYSENLLKDAQAWQELCGKYAPTLAWMAELDVMVRQKTVQESPGGVEHDLRVGLANDDKEQANERYE